MSEPTSEYRQFTNPLHEARRIAEEKLELLLRVARKRTREIAKHKHRCPTCGHQHCGSTEG